MAKELNEEALLDDELENIFNSDDEVENKETTNTNTENSSEGVDADESQDGTISDEDMQNLFKEQEPKDTKDKKTSNKSTTDDKNQARQPGSSNPQDLVGPDGTVLAKAGAERRFYEENQKLKREAINFNTQVLPAIKQQYQQMEAQVQSFRGVVEGLRASDLSPEDIQSGLDFVRSWRKNPQDVVKFLLTSLQSSGIDIDINGMQPTIQASVMKKMIDEKFEPFIQEREYARQEQEREYEVEQEYNSFVQRYPDSVVHDKTLGFMIRNNPNLSPEMAYTQLQNYYLRKGLDFSKPLEEYTQPSKQTQPTVMPKAPNVNSNLAASKSVNRMANATDSFNSIIKQSMADAGIR